MVAFCFSDYSQFGVCTFEEVVSSSSLRQGKTFTSHSASGSEEAIGNIHRQAGLMTGVSVGQGHCPGLRISETTGWILQLGRSAGWAPQVGSGAGWAPWLGGAVG